MKAIISQLGRNQLRISTDLAHPQLRSTYISARGIAREAIHISGHEKVIVPPDRRRERRNDQSRRLTGRRRCGEIVWILQQAAEHEIQATGVITLFPGKEAGLESFATG